jgi:predicted dehydrogenase
VAIVIEKSKETGELKKVLNVGIVGCGLIGRRRAQVAHASENEQVAVVADVDLDAAMSLANETDSRATADWQKVVDDPVVDIVVVATPNRFLMPVAVAALGAGKHVLCEKPPGRNLSETKAMVEAARQYGRVLKVGFNHRYHPAIWKAHKLLEQGVIGEIMYGRAVYGHGGRPGYDQEWRADPELSGGGEMLDQGVHIVDLFRWFMGEFASVLASSATYYWSLGSFGDGRQLEDNAFAILQTPHGQIAQLHTSWTQWKNRFSFEVFGQDGFLSIEGLGGSYGAETLTVGRRRPESGPPILETFTFEGPDNSWQLEWSDFIGAVRDGHEPLSSGEDALGTMAVIAAFYKSASSGESAPV